MTPLVGLIVLIGVFVLGIGIDIFLVTDKVEDNTWSEIIRMYAERSILIPWILGVLEGHWFHWFMEGKAFVASHMWALISISVGMVITSIMIAKFVHPFPNYLLMLTLQLGLFAGAMLWRV